MFLTFTFFLTPVGLILLYVSFKLNNKTEKIKRKCQYKQKMDSEYELNAYDEEMLEGMR